MIRRNNCQHLDQVSWTSRHHRVNRVSNFAASIQTASIPVTMIRSSPRRREAAYLRRAMTKTVEASRCHRATNATIICRRSQPRCRRCCPRPAALAPMPLAIRIRRIRALIRHVALVAVQTPVPKTRLHTPAIRTYQVILHLHIIIVLHIIACLSLRPS